MSKLAFLGPLGTFTHQAAKELLKPGEKLTPYPDIQAVYDAVADGECASAVVAIENTVEGPVIPSIDRLLNGEFFASERVDVQISFSALSLPNALRNEIKTAISHPHALAQCKNFVLTNKLTTKESTSTAAACTQLSPTDLALAPKICSEVYGLSVVEDAVEDFDAARTTFFRISNQKPFIQADSNRTYLAITPRRIGPGTLARICESLAKEEINIFSLLTRPLRNSPGAYTFIFELAGNFEDLPLKQVLTQWIESGDYIKILGSYAHEIDESLNVRDLSIDKAPIGSFGKS